MHECAFADVTRPSPAHILGLPLREYSIGHEIQLIRQRNALIFLDETTFRNRDFSEQVFALQQAVIICSDTWENRRRIEIPGSYLIRKWWHNRLLSIWQRRHIRRISPLDLSEAIKRFYLYLAEGRTLPPTPSKEADTIANDSGETDRGREFGAPFVAQLYLFAITELKKSELAAYDMGYARTAWLYFTHHESVGKYRIRNRREHQIDQELSAVKSELSVESTQP